MPAEEIPKIMETAKGTGMTYAFRFDPSVSKGLPIKTDALDPDDRRLHKDRLT